MCSDESVEIEFQSPSLIACNNIRPRQRKFQTRSNENKIDGETVDKIVNEAIEFLVS